MDVKGCKETFLDNLVEINCKHSYDHFFVYLTNQQERLLICNECQNSISLNVYFCYLFKKNNILQQVEEYVKWTQDYTIPCRLYTDVLHDRVIVEKIITNYDTIMKGYKLLQILHAPLLSGSVQDPSDITFFQNTMEEGLNKAIASFSGNNSIHVIVRSVLIFIQSIVRSNHYFTVLAPHVKNVQGCPLKKSHTSKFLDDSIKDTLCDSISIFNTFSRISLSFEAVQVAGLCCLCQDSQEMVRELILNFLINICRGAYDYPIMEDYLRTLFETTTTWIANNMEAYWTDLEEKLSEKFFRIYFTLKAHFAKRFVNNVVLLRFDTNVNFLIPRILFQNYINYYAFSAALMYYSMGSSEYKAIYRFVRTYLYEVYLFNKRLEERQTNDKMISNVFKKQSSEDLVKLFFEKNPTFERELVNACEKWVNFTLYPNWESTIHTGGAIRNTGEETLMDELTEGCQSLTIS